MYVYFPAVPLIRPRDSDQPVAVAIPGALNVVLKYHFLPEEKKTLLGRKVMTNLDRILKSRDITLPSSQGYGFSCGRVWM